LGLPTIIFLVVAGVVLFPTLKAIGGSSSLSQEEKNSEKRKQTIREKEGALGTLARIIVGDDRFENAKINIADKERKEIKRQQAKKAGFKTVEEFELKTDTNRNPNKFLPKDKDGNPIQDIRFAKKEPIRILTRFGGQKRRFSK